MEVVVSGPLRSSRCSIMSCVAGCEEPCVTPGCDTGQAERSLRNLRDLRLS